MGWSDCKAGQGNFLNLKEDKETITVVVVGEPMVKVNEQGRKRVFLNAARGEDIKAGKMSILPLNITTAEALAKKLKAEDGKASLVGKQAVKITRNGVKGDKATTYAVELAGKLGAAEVKALAAIKPNDLAGISYGEVEGANAEGVPF
jgi:hypothetical protein